MDNLNLDMLQVNHDNNNTVFSLMLVGGWNPYGQTAIVKYQ